MPVRLKSLELQGYKTFANRALFEFSERVTAVVGPNGSGKSNIADSLRWVLGEQSFSLLRGKKTEDMIFSGSESRPRAGMALATVTFDNSDGWLPIDFSEVAITRRAYRDGDNEYLVNGQRVRLRDVNELLGQSGLSERTYTVIGQGLVDAALSLKAEERRRLFEEAAGIGLHRARREDALRRLDSTRRNLDRVKDILAELQPRLQSLERQARRAQEYDQVRADLRVLLRDWYGYHWHRSQHELQEARHSVRTHELRLDTARLEQAALELKLSEVRDRLNSLRQELNGLHRQSSELHTQREALSRELAVADERERSLRSQMVSSDAELVRLQEDQEINQEQLNAAVMENQRLAQELKDARLQANQAREALTRRQAERSQAERDLQTIRQEMGGLNARQGQLQAQLSERQSQSERLQKSLETAVQAVENAMREQQILETRLNDSRRQTQAADQSRRSAEEAVQSQRKRLDQAEQNRRKIQEKRAILSTDLARLQARLDVLDQAEASLAGYAGGTKILLQAARKQLVQGVKGALSTFLDVPSELEPAVAAALGDTLDAVLLDTELDQALEILDKEASRGVLIPLSRLRTDDALAIRRETLLDESAGVLGLASEMVRITPGSSIPEGELLPVLQLLLGSVVIVRDRKTAFALASSQPPGVRFVTLQGDVVHASGQIQASGYSTSSDAASSQAVHQARQQSTLLSRSRQRRDLANERLRLDGDLHRVDEQLASLDTDLKAAQTEMEQASQVARQAVQDSNQASIETNQARLAVQQAEKQLTWQREQGEQLRADLQGTGVAMQEMKKELAQVETDQVETRLRQRQAITGLESLSLDEFQSQVAHWNTLVTVAERSLASAGARSQERRTALEKVQRAQAALHLRYQANEQALGELEERRGAQRMEETALNDQIHHLQVLIDPVEAELQSLETRQEEEQKAEAASRAMP